MSEFIIENAEKHGAPPLIAFWGPSGCGKTMTALLVARGIVGMSGQIGVIDTENGRARYHAEVARGDSGKPWLRLDLQPPFSPDRYTAACKALIEAGADIVIIDSGSHVWEGEGGVLEVAEKNPSKGLKKWAAGKTAYKRMVNNLLRATVPVIWCLRSKEGFSQVGGKVTNEGLVPISGKGLIYEMTFSVLLSLDNYPAFRDGKAPYNSHPTILPVKCPDDMRQAIKPEKKLGVEFGQAIAKWVNGSGDFNKPEAELLQRCRDKAAGGTGELVEFMKTLTDSDQSAMRKHWKSELEPLAKSHDPLPPADDFPGDQPSNL